ncbi:hypothetical protein B0H13DRAFT_2377684 [Mycena leptocephala]|nr:hypothetical protein B0H13DRAFT_2377684 [Mycena leptocephala]
MSGTEDISTADSAATGTQLFLSAASQPTDGGPLAGDNAASGTANYVPPHRRLKVHQDPDTGAAYLVDRDTGERYDVSDDESVLPNLTRQSSPDGRRSPPSGSSARPSRTPSTESDATPTDDGIFIPSEDLLAALVTDLRTEWLTEAQLSRFSALRGILSMSRQSLFTTTGLVAGQRDNIRDIADSIREFRDEVATRIDELSTAVIGATHQLESTLENNLRILRATGATKEQLASLATAVRKGQDYPLPSIIMPPVRADPLPDTTELGDMRAAVDNALPPRHPSESAEAFQRRGNAALGRRVRAAATFQAADPPAPDQQPASILKQTRFTSMDSISSAGARGAHTHDRGLDIEPMGLNQSISGYLTPQYAGTGTATVFEAFVVEKSTQIIRMIERQLGEAMEAPPRSPKLRDPPMYKGDDDDTIFMTWLGRLCTWFQGYSLGGPKFDAHRIVYLKSALDVHALNWFEAEVEPNDRDSDINHEFIPIICAMHKRFITSATATHATKEYEAIRYDPVQGIEFLVSELLRTAHRMREAPSSFSIRQRFMRLIPAPVHDELIRRGLFVEYTTLDVLKGHARSWIESQGQMRGGAATSTARSPRTAVAPRSGSTWTLSKAPARAALRAPTQAPVSHGVPITATRTATATPRVGPTMASGPAPRSSKTCFGCGVVGHIASDPICPWYSESASSRPRPATQFHAQRVVSSYSIAEGDHPEDHAVDADGIDTVPDQNEEMEGLWGGSQYEGDELLDDHPGDNEVEEGRDEGEPDDPNVAPDLDELLDDVENDEVRVGAMRQYPRIPRQYFSLRVTPDDEGGDSPAALRNSSIPSNARSTVLDMDALVVDVAGTGYPLWSAADEAASDELQRRHHAEERYDSHEGLLSAFNALHGPGPSRPTCRLSCKL